MEHCDLSVDSFWFIMGVTFIGCGVGCLGALFGGAIYQWAVFTSKSLAEVVRKIL